MFVSARFFSDGFLLTHAPLVVRASISAKAGRDCTEDYDFHRSKGRALWKQFKVGLVVDCKGPALGGAAAAPRKKKPWLLSFW